MGLPEAVAASPAPERVQGGEEEEGEEDVVRAPHGPAHRAAGSSPERVRKRWEGAQLPGRAQGSPKVTC